MALELLKSKEQEFLSIVAQLEEKKDAYSQLNDSVDQLNQDIDYLNSELSCKDDECDNLKQELEEFTAASEAQTANLKLGGRS